LNADNCNPILKKSGAANVPLFLFPIKLRSFQFSVFNFQFIRTFAAMKKIAWFGFVLLLLLASVSCTKKPAVTPPADLIGEDTIVQMVAEQLILESTVFNAPPIYDKDGLTRALYSQLFEKYNVSVPRYRSSLSYYLSDKERMNDILTQAKVLIDKKKDSLPIQ
jgi:hypothetical protein